MLQVLPPLVEVIPGARLDLAVRHLRCGALKEAHRLLKDIPPAAPQECTLGMPLSPALVHAVLVLNVDSAAKEITAQHFSLPCIMWQHSSNVPCSRRTVECSERRLEMLLHIRARCAALLYFKDDEVHSVQAKIEIGIAASQFGPRRRRLISLLAGSA